MGSPIIIYSKTGYGFGSIKNQIQNQSSQNWQKIIFKKKKKVDQERVKIENRLFSDYLTHCQLDKSFLL